MSLFVQLPSHAWLFVTPWTVACQASLSFTISQSLFKLTSIKSVMPTNCLSLIPLSSCPQFFPVSGSFPMSWLFASGGQKCWNFSFSINPSNDSSGLISFRIDWFDILTVQGTVKNLLYHHSWNHQFFSSQSSLWPSSQIHTWYWKDHSFNYTDLCW